MEKAAIALVEFEENDENTLKVSDEALKEIENLPTTYGIKTIAVVGPGRIGKSSLLNMLVGKNVFEIGSEMERVTKGIWMFIDTNDDTQLANVYLDVEGFGDPSKSNVDENDYRFLNIVTQICDVVLYNIRGVYDKDTCVKITCVCSLFDRYRKNNVILEKPILVSVLRDFHYSRPEFPDKKFEKLFEDSPSLLKTFRETKVFMLSNPLTCGVDDMASIPHTDPSNKFVQEITQMKKYLAENTKPLCAAQNKTITGIVLAENIRRTVQHINDDDLEMLSKSLAEIFKEYNDVIRKSALETYKTEMGQKWPPSSQPETLTELHEMEKKNACEHIDKKCFPVSESVQLDVDKQVFVDEIEQMFKDMQKDKCKEAIESATYEIEENLRGDVYFEDGGAERFLNDYDKAEKAYSECRNLGTEKLDIWEKYKEGMETTKRIIQQTANAIEITKRDANSEEEIKEKYEKLEREMKELKVIIKRFERTKQYYEMLNGTLSFGQFLISVVRGTVEIRRNLAMANQPSGQLFNLNALLTSGASPQASPQEAESLLRNATLTGIFWAGKFFVDFLRTTQ